MPKLHKIWVSFWLTALVVVGIWGAIERAKRPLPGWEDERPFKVPL